MFKAEDAVSVDMTAYELAFPGTIVRVPGVVLAAVESDESYYVRVRLRFGAVIDVKVPGNKVGPPGELRSNEV